MGAGSPLFWLEIYLCIYQSLRMLHWRRKQGGREGRRMKGEHNMYMAIIHLTLLCMLGYVLFGHSVTVWAVVAVQSTNV